MIAVDFQYSECMIALMCWTVQFSPAHTDTFAPGCSLNETGGLSHETAGSLCALMSVMNCSGVWTFLWSGPFQTWSIACMAL
jgi:hypothetical protein